MAIILLVTAELRKLTDNILITNRESSGFPFLKLIMYAKNESLDITIIINLKQERNYANQKMLYSRLEIRPLSITVIDYTLNVVHGW